MEIKEGNIFTNLKVIKYSHGLVGKLNRKIEYWNCECFCGNYKIVSSRYLKERKNHSCGCIKKQQNKQWGESRLLINGKAALNNLYLKYKSSANRRGYNFDLTIDQFQGVTSRNCNYCGLEPKQYSYSNGSKTSNYIYNGIDRLNNNIGYEFDNIVPCCKVCNFAKRSMLQEDFRNWLIRIVNFNKSYLI